MAHDHDNAHRTAAARHKGRLLMVLAITLTVLVIEVIGAVLSGSLTLLADAGHLAADATGVSIALLAVWLAARPASERRTFGLQRAEVLAAGLNAVILLGLAAYIVYEAVSRFAEPPEVGGTMMLVVGVVGLIANLICLALLRRGQAESMNVRGAFLEVLADALGSVAVIVAALVVSLTGFDRADIFAALAIGVLIVPRTLRLLKEAIDVLLEAVPNHLDLAVIRGRMEAVPGVLEVHDLHVWTITSGSLMLSAHVTASEAHCAGPGPLLDELGRLAEDEFSISHTTFQVEPHGHRDHEAAVLHT